MANGRYRAAAADPGGVTARVRLPIEQGSSARSDSSFLTMASRRASKRLDLPVVQQLPTSPFELRPDPAP